MIPTPITFATPNPYALLADNISDDDDDTNIPHSSTTAISDSGATSHFITAHAPVRNLQIDPNPITVTLPDGNTIRSTHTCNLDLPHLPDTVTQAHIIPGLAHSSLLSIARFCDNGYTVTYDKQKCTIRDGSNNTVLQGQRNPHTMLWEIPITATPHPVAQPSLPHHLTHHAAHHVHTIPHIQNRVKYMHQAMFCPPIQTLLRAVNLGFLQGFPFLTSHNVTKHLVLSPATVKGRMRLTPQGHQSTRRLAPTPNTPANIFCFAALADKQNRTFYTDCTGALPARSLDGHHYFFVAYDYDTNYIFAIPIPSTTNDAIITAFEQVYNDLTTRGYRPLFNVTDNQASTPIANFLRHKGCSLQIVEPNNHRINAAERAIQTFKNHFISGLCITDRDFPFQLWSHLTTQATITCNLLRRSRLNPNISAYHQLHGHPYDWNAHPLAPPGTRAIILDPPHQRTSWGPRGIDAWYCGPALQHYRCHHFYVPSTRGMRISGNYALFPTHCVIPKLSPTEHTREVILELARCMATLTPHQQDQTLDALHAAIDDVDHTTTLPWHAQPLTTKGETSTNPTAPTIAKTAPKIHLRQTRNNTPIPLPTPHTTPSVTTRPAIPPPTTTPTTQPEVRRSPRIALLSPRTYSNNAIDALHSQSEQPHLDHFCAPVIHPTTGKTISKYHVLLKDPLLRDTWSRAFGKEFGNLAQGDPTTNTPGTNSIYVLTHDQIKHIPKDRVVMYTRIVVDYRPQKTDPNRVRLTAGGNLIDYPGELTTRTADLTTTKILWNSTISTPGAKYLCIDIKNFYLGTPMTRYEYMKIQLSAFPQHIIDQYDLATHALNGYVYVEIRKAIYGLPQAGILANQLLKKRLRPHGYYEVPHTPGLWKHVTRPIQFTLTVDDFGVKYTGKEHAQHLIDALNQHYKLEIDWDGKLYCGISLKWDYDARHVDISMPGYITKLLEKFQHPPPAKPQHSPHPAPRRTFKPPSQSPIAHDTSPPLPQDRLKRVQQIVGAILYYARAVDITTLVALSAIAATQSCPTEQTEKHLHHLLDYLATHNDATIRYRPSAMILNIHSDASYLTEPKARSRLGGFYFLGTNPQNNQPLQLNGPIHVMASICKFVVASAAEAELGALFHNCQDGKIFRLVLQELGHPQPPTPVHCDNETAVSIANNTVKRQRSRAMEMRFFWVADQVNIGNFNVTWHPGQENLADYFTKHFDASHHITVRPWYLHTDQSPTTLPRALAPRTLKGCVGPLPHGYARSTPLPRLSHARRTTSGSTSLPTRRGTQLTALKSQEPLVVAH